MDDIDEFDREIYSPESSDGGPDWPTVIFVIVLIAGVSFVSIIGVAWLSNALRSFGVT